MTTTSPGIPTLYRGIQYRSRLEARWAAFFDGLGWQTTYEPFDGDGYIPDFLVHTTEPFLTEIKPAATEVDYRTQWPKINDGLIDHWQSAVFVGGVTPLPTCFWQCQFPEMHPAVAGAMSQRNNGVCDDCCTAYFVAHNEEKVIWEDWDGQPCPHWRSFWSSGSAIPEWRMDERGRIGLWFDDFAAGRYPGQQRTLLFGIEGALTARGVRERIEELWATATNDVKWHGRDV
jgi:hypothetical protein